MEANLEKRAKGKYKRLKKLTSPEKRKWRKTQKRRTDSGTEDDHLIQGTKVFNDSVHGHIEMHPLLVSIIDTPEFQRLRFIKQLGMCYFVYPGASHNRFEHSLGVSYLAGELARSLQSKQKSLKITKEDILCVKIAGLCHDLGHGPFSHLFDEAFLPKVSPGYKGKHEKLSVNMFEHMLKKNNLREQFKKYNLQEGDIMFIKEQIDGDEEKMKEIWSYEGRTKDKSYLYEIVANKRNGIDVDKWDYFARDSMHLGIQNPFDWKALFRFARVLHEPDGSQICTRDKEIFNLYDMFHTRYSLHHRAYQHKVNKILEAMCVEALFAAKDYLLLPGEGRKMKTISQSIEDMEAYSKLNDHIMWTILCTKDGELDTSKDLFNRILTRDLYFVSARLSSRRKLLTKRQRNRYAIFVDILLIHYGMGEKDPVEHVNFTPSDPNNTVEISKIRQYKSLLFVWRSKVIWSQQRATCGNLKKAVSPESEHQRSSHMHGLMALPREFSERFIRVCVKQRDDKDRERVREAFEKWCSHKGLKAKPGDFSAGMSWTKNPSSEERKLDAENVSKRLFSK
ncbi:putative deoxynucleoside triphosphate triphosphohydrolase SAMHD1-like [Apostichopus japonicus]|uniref:Putative deoxynucleoside triphosphate triphosphohydrolase SAMHD1-like n=1 Tax=Stichopus japonicus TaxID=307972 RepID=A0A2G8KIH9_STIJA|nr:putative deoxynucleoside triphosphate triphosphohydrolase SAMHD1-like [Apostichopus japonicus]